MMLTPVEREILVDLLVHGDNLSGNVTENIERSRQHVSKTMGKLEDRRLVRDKGKGVYTLTLSGTEVARELYHE